MGERDEQLLGGGLEHAGLVVRVGDTVRRAADPHGPGVLALLQGTAFLRRRVTAGEPAFVELWRRRGGEEGLDARLARLVDSRDALRMTLS